jgi:hypothetical protein
MAGISMVIRTLGVLRAPAADGERAA